jgi:hypothetical protein
MLTKIAAILLAVANAIVWGVLAALYSYLGGSLIVQNLTQQAPLQAENVRLFWGLGAVLLLLLMGPIQYCAGLFFSVLLLIRDMGSGKFADACVAGAVFLIIGIPDAGLGILMLGST